MSKLHNKPQLEKVKKK